MYSKSRSGLGCISWINQYGVYNNERFSDAHLMQIFSFLSFFSSSGGMEELTLEQIKKKSELEEDIDFENGENSLDTV